MNQHMFATRQKLVGLTNETRSSMHDSTGLFSLSLRYARNVERVGVKPAWEGAIVARGRGGGVDFVRIMRLLNCVTPPILS